MLVIEIDKFITYLESMGLGSNTISLYITYFKLINFDTLSIEKNEYIFSFVKRYNNGIVRAMLSHLLEYLKSCTDLSDSLYDVAYHCKIPKFSGSKKQTELEVPTKDQVLQLA
ncbi:hypothetical protein LCGC14_2665960, partial [marine sediment metagenome]